MDKLDDYNAALKYWNFSTTKTEDFLRLISERNLFILERTPLVDFKPENQEASKNRAVIDYKLLEQPTTAFHVGLPHQKRLYSLEDEETGHNFNEGVFFSLNPKDISNFARIGDSPTTMIYLASSLNEARVQINYRSSVISRHDLDDLLISKASKEEKKEAHRRLNRKWIERHTLPFEESLSKDGWLVLPDPIEVKY